MSNKLINDITVEEVKELVSAYDSAAYKNEQSLKDYHLKNDEVITDAFVKLSNSALKDTGRTANMAEIYKVAFPTGLAALEKGKVGLRLDMNGLREIAGFDINVVEDEKRRSLRHEVIYDIRDNKVKSCVYENEKMQSVRILEGLHFVASEMRKKLPAVLRQTLQAKADVDNAVATHDVLVNNGLHTKSDYITAANNENVSKKLRNFLNRLDIDRYYDADSLRPVLDAVRGGKAFTHTNVVNTTTPYSEGVITALKGNVGKTHTVTITDNEIMLDKLSSKYSIELSDLSKSKLGDALMLEQSKLDAAVENKKDKSYSEQSRMTM